MHTQFMASGIVHLVTRVLQLRKELVKVRQCQRLCHCQCQCQSEVLAVACLTMAPLPRCVAPSCRAHPRQSHRARYAYTLVVAFLCALLTFPASFLRKPYRVVINDVFTSGDSMGDWDEPSSFTSLLVYLVVATIITPLCLSLPIPCGLFTPLFCFGAVFGRAFGEMASAFAPSSGIVPGAYAVVGAAALTSGATQTLSTTVIVFELTGQLHHMVPVLLATVIAYSVAGASARRRLRRVPCSARGMTPLPPPCDVAVAGSWSISIYDVLLQLKGLPYLPRAHSRGLYNKTAQVRGPSRHTRPLAAAKVPVAADSRAALLWPGGVMRRQDLMHRDVRYLVLNKSTYADAARLVRDHGTLAQAFVVCALRLTPLSPGLAVQLSLIPLGGPRGQQLFEFPIVDDEHNMALVVRGRMWFLPTALTVCKLVTRTPRSSRRVYHRRRGRFYV